MGKWRDAESEAEWWDQWRSWHTLIFCAFVGFMVAAALLGWFR